MVTAVWIALTLLGALLYGVLVYLVSVGSAAEGMRDPATAPMWRVLLAAVGKRRPESAEAREESCGEDRYQAA